MWGRIAEEDPASDDVIVRKHTICFFDTITLKATPTCKSL